MLLNKRVQAIITADLNLESDDPLIEAAEQLSDPETPDISERFNVKYNVRKEAKDRLKEQKDKKAREERIRMEQEHLAITKLQVSAIKIVVENYRKQCQKYQMRRRMKRLKGLVKVSIELLFYYKRESETRR